jgi:hypothetical protein
VLVPLKELIPDFEINLKENKQQERKTKQEYL